MKFLCDVHISFKLLQLLTEKYPGSVHVNNILDSYLTKDESIIDYADTHDFIIVTKDKDFKNAFLVRHKPKKLIKVNLGNLSNAELIRIISVNLPKIEHLNLLKESFMIEINNQDITITELNY
ncbi:MAG: hypothetical protein K0R65_2902 [Crocinitomicaceae bacterium]|jgi:predicted nuclease of predicted toxin-antitoxin system|nr:hypothetical protein [Crocinitomicaceae bacterium]